LIFFTKGESSARFSRLVIKVVRTGKITDTVGEESDANLRVAASKGSNTF
jgi:hypothetical protein